MRSCAAGTHPSKKYGPRDLTHNGPQLNMSTLDLISQIPPSSTRRKRSYPIARILADGSLQIRIAPATWTAPMSVLPVPLFRLLPIWQQRIIAKRATGVKKGLMLFDGHAHRNITQD
jgi:hypothetical protein